MQNKVLLSFFISFLCLQSFGQSNEITLSSGESDEIQHAILQLKGFGTIHIKGALLVDHSITIPSGISLKINENGAFKIQKGSVFKIVGAFEAGLHKVFNRSVEFSNKSVVEVKAEWFGSDDTAINHALLSAAEIPVRIAKDVVITNSIIIDSFQTLLINDNIRFLPTNEMTGVAVITNKNKSDTDIRIFGGIIDGSGADKVAYDGILFNTVRNSSVTNLSCLNVHTTASSETGNIRLNNCQYVLLKNCHAKGTWKMGILVINGSCNAIIGGKFYGTHDSAIGVVNSTGTTIDGVFVDNCGTSDGSNMSLNAEWLLVINNTSINASGKRNGNGITLGHDGAPASYSVCSNNLISNNNAKGVFIQGESTENVIVLSNTIKGNGLHSDGTNSGGIAVYSNTKGHLISDNYISNNRLGVSLHKTSSNVLIIDNHITSSTLYGVRNDGDNISLKGNYLFNTTNIHNGMNSYNLMLEDNIMKSE